MPVAIHTTPLTEVGPAIRQIVQVALLEDLAQGDLTTDHLASLQNHPVGAVIRTRKACVVSGLSVAREVFRQVDPAIVFETALNDGDTVGAVSVLASVRGSAASLLKAERTALNFLQHLCGIATETRRFADKLHGTRTVISHTRKTTPGLRLLERQAVTHGGGKPHRYNLGSAVMLKDNHLLAYPSSQPIFDAVRELRQKVSHTVKIEVEADALAQVQEALSAGADIILLDNMTPEQVQEAVTLIDGRAITEASGNISLETVRLYAEAGVDVVSTSKITLGAPAVDIGLDFTR